MDKYKVNMKKIKGREHEIEDIKDIVSRGGGFVQVVESLGNNIPNHSFICAYCQNPWFEATRLVPTKALSKV